MPKLYLGKISPKHPEQFEKNFYAAGKKGTSWYGGIEPGDYVFPIFNSSVSKLWRVTNYNSNPNAINEQGSVEFEVVKEFSPVRISAVFARNRFFQLDINLVNKLTKSTGSAEVSFFEIKLEDDAPAISDINPANSRNLYIAIESAIRKPPYQDNDIRVLISNDQTFTIQAIEIYKANKFDIYQPLQNLYLTRNREERHSLLQLLQFAELDKATNKQDYLKSVIEELSEKGYFTVTSPVGLYDNVLVGRKVSKSKKQDGDNTVEVPASESPAISDQDEEEYEKFVELLDENPNLIIYGPPGTGKTHSIKKIIELFDRSKTKIFKSYEQIRQEDRIAFITFHQSFSYEEFIEGLRPVLFEKDNTNGEVSQNLQYKIQDGILKQISSKAEIGIIKSEFAKGEIENLSESKKIWKISLGRRGQDNYIYEECLRTNRIAIGWLEKTDLTGWTFDEILQELNGEKGKNENRRNDASSIENFINEMQIGDVVLVFASLKEIRAVGVVTGEYQYDKSKDEYPHVRSVNWLRDFNPSINISRYNDGKNLTLKTLYPLDRFTFSDVKEILQHGQTPEQHSKTTVPYYLVIDEINRGNISKIFGEMITLIEKDKRGSATCRLPYSQRDFSLPPNLYIIGTMNSSDRSIAVLDVALRRRFFFKEIEPDVSKIIDSNPTIEGVNMETLFTKLNSKIAQKLDRDHRIGHSHFMNVHSVRRLWLVWYHQIIPLLQEYFYNDAATISEIIGEVFISKNNGEVHWIYNLEEFKMALSAIS